MLETLTQLGGLTAGIVDAPAWPLLNNGVLLCSHHHRLIHQGDWEVRMAADGLPEFIPPHYVDSERKPRRNIYHRRQ